jgi:hypothetical protein
MSWAAFFWILYGAGSTLFVIYLFKLGKNVASNRKELVQQEIQRMRSRYSDEAGVLESLGSGVTRSFAGDDTQRLRVQHIYQPDGEHVAVQGVRDGEHCVINLPVGKGDGVARGGSNVLSGKEKHR